MKPDDQTFCSPSSFCETSLYFFQVTKLYFDLAAVTEAVLKVVLLVIQSVRKRDVIVAFVAEICLLLNLTDALWYLNMLYVYTFQL